MSERCLEGVWRVSGRCWKVSGLCLDGDWIVSVGVMTVFGGSLGCV